MIDSKLESHDRILPYLLRILDILEERGHAL